MPISTPCIGICILDEAAGFCLGCGRTRDEIAGWRAMSEETRRAVMTTLSARLDAHRSGGEADAAHVSGGD